MNDTSSQTNKPKTLAQMLKKPESRVGREIYGLIVALLVALVIRTFMFQPFNIPSGSMYPTLMIGDFLFVSKYTYGLTKYSFPFAPPIFEGRIGAKQPERGQVVVFRGSHDDRDYIKRLVGLPGEKVQVIKGVLHINGEPVKLERIEDYVMVTKEGRVQVMPQYIETLPNGLTHKILKDFPFGEGRLDNTPEFIVPEGHYFMMGDNRDHSSDSRVPEMIGFVPFDHLLGRAEILFFSTEAKWYEPLEWIPGVRLERIFQLIR